VAYPLSFGPACWISSRTGRGIKQINWLYQPVLRTWADGPKLLATPSHWYAQLLSADGWSAGRWRDTGDCLWGNWMAGTELETFPSHFEVYDVDSD